MTVQDPWIGRQLAGFKIERLLGRGGMASVYFGWDLKLQRPVAIKMIDDRYRGDPAYLERFRREAQVIAAWHHPNILQIYSAGEEEGQTFFVMEYIRGRDLRQALDQYARTGRSISYSEVIRLGRAVASALDYAHSRGVIHRDVKPSNIIVAEDGRVVLADFGLALQSTATTLGQVFGSPHYISPEQARNSAHAVPQSDQYSFAVTLYEMLTGIVPFDDPNPTTLALMHINDAPPAPRTVNPALSPQVEVVLLRALSKLPQQRYPTTHTLMDALESALQGGVADSQPVTMQVLPLQRTSIPQTPPDHTAVAGRGAYVGGRNTGSTTGGNFGGSIPNGPGSTVAGGGYPVDWPARPAPRRGSFARWATCGVLLMALLVLLSLGVLAFNLPGQPLAALFGTPTRAAGQAPLPSETPLPPSATPPPDTPTAQPSQTPDLAATQTAAAPPPTATVPPPLPTFTPTLEPSPTVPSPTRTPLVYQFALVGREDESVFLVNTGALPLPLIPIRLGEGNRAIPGEEWQVAELQPGQCIAAWSDGRNPPVPRDLECERVGEDVLRSGNRRFWTRSYEVFYNEQPIVTCDTRDEPCLIQLTVP